MAKPPIPESEGDVSALPQWEDVIEDSSYYEILGVLEIADCAAASGAFTVAVRTRDDSGQEKPLEFSETWQRTDGEDVTFTADYPIGENVELLSVRLRGLTCSCADTAIEAPPLAEE